MNEQKLEQNLAREFRVIHTVLAIIFFNTYVSALATVDEQPYGKIMHIWIMLVMGLIPWMMSKIFPK